MLITDRIIKTITDEVEKRVIKNLENLKFNIEVTVVKQDDTVDNTIGDSDTTGSTV